MVAVQPTIIQRLFKLIIQKVATLICITNSDVEKQGERKSFYVFLFCEIKLF